MNTHEMLMRIAEDAAAHAVNDIMDMAFPDASAEQKPQMMQALRHPVLAAVLSAMKMANDLHYRKALRRGYSAPSSPN